MRISDLAQRLDLKPSQADVSLSYVNAENDPDGNGYYTMDVAGRPINHDVAAKFERFSNLLGLEEDSIRAENLSDLEALVDRALAQAPRLRVR